MCFSKLLPFLIILILMLFSCGTLVGSIPLQGALDDKNETSRFFSHDLLETSRKKKKAGKYLLPLLFGALMIKAVIFPLAFKVMAVMSSIAVLFSTMSLIVSSIIGYIKLAAKSHQSSVKVVHVNDNYPVTWAKDDDAFKNYGLESVDYDPYAPTDQTYYPYIK